MKRYLGLITMLFAMPLSALLAEDAKATQGKEGVSGAGSAKDQAAGLTAGVFGDHMVLQRQMEVPVWGTTVPGGTVTVKFMNQTKTAKADDKGQWRVKLDAMETVSEPQELTVTDGKEMRTFQDVLVGEVWLCSGQSNMEFPVKWANNKRTEMAAATDGQIRHLKVPVRTLSQPNDRFIAQWTVCSTDTVGEFTACGYFMARRLRKELNVPIGLINASHGGSRIEAWTPPVGFRGIPALAGISREVDLFDMTLEANRGRDPNARIRVPKGTRTIRPFAERYDPKKQPTTLYNGMIHALVGYGMRGVIWYQGESNRADGMLYAEKMKALIGGWRNIWDIGEFPVYFVQIAPFRYAPDPKDTKGDGDPTLLARFWAAQRAAAASIPNTGMAVINDIGNLRDAHPRNKQEVGRRLALLALHHTYGRKEIECSGPVFKAATVEGDKIRVKFEHAAGLKSRDGKPLSWFEIRGEGTEWTKAEATIDGETILVSAPEVAKPLSVRFAWNKMAEPNLANSAGLPTAAFNTSPDANVNPKK